MDKKPKIIVNGQELKDLENCPPELRALLKDENNNKIPDILEGGIGKFLIGGNLAALINAGQAMNKYIVDGKEFSAVNQMPPEIQQKLKNKLRELEHTSPQAAAIVKNLTGTNPAPLSDLGPNKIPTSQVLGTTKPVRSVSPNRLPGVKEDYRSKALIFLGIIALIGWLISEYGEQIF